MLRRLFLSGHLYLWILWGVLLAIYLDTVQKTGDYRNAGLVLILLVVLYFAEGMEIAVATLADKDASQLGSESAKATLNFIKVDPEWFFAQRQVFVVTIVSFMSLMTTFETIFIPFFDQSISKNSLSIPLFSLTIPVDAPFWFTLIFTSFTILWWCQVFPKRLALRNSEIFLRQSALLMGPIRAIGSFNLPGPADQLVRLASRYTSYKQLSSLKPSRAYYYETAVMLYGFAVDRASTRITIRADGSATVSQKVLLLFIHGRRSSTTGTVSADSPFIDWPTVRLLSLHTCPVPEKLEMIRSQLDQIFEGQIPTAGHVTFASQGAQTLAPAIDYEPPTTGQHNQRVSWTINWGAPLPNRFMQGGSQTPIVAALLYEVSVPFGPQAYSKNDFFQFSSETPCRKFTLRVEPAAGYHARIELTNCTATSRGVSFQDETERVIKAVREKAELNEFHLDYPMPATVYKAEWEG